MFLGVISSVAQGQRRGGLPARAALRRRRGLALRHQLTSSRARPSADGAAVVTLPDGVDGLSLHACEHVHVILGDSVG